MLGVGAAVGNYVIRAKLGEGGMGIVYLAEHPLIGRHVAIKVIHPDYARDPESVSRFFVEAQAVNRIHHPNIVDVTDYGQTPEGESYFIMEYLRGESLRARLLRARLELGECLHVAAQIADALGASHAAGILHRDLKPDNVFLVAHGEDPLYAKVLDFGLAKLTGNDDRQLHRTRTGAVMGTAFYMAPEQCEGRPDVDARADIYALGVMLFEMVSGQVPFSGNSYGELIIKHVTKPPPRAIEVNPACPPWLDAAIARALAKAPGDRFPSMIAFRDALRHGQRAASQPVLAFAATMPPPPAVAPPAPISTLGHAAGEARPRAPRRRSGALAIGAALAVVGVAAGVALVLRGGRKGAPAEEPPAATVAPPPAPDAAPAAAPTGLPPPALATQPSQMVRSVDFLGFTADGRSFVLRAGYGADDGTFATFHELHDTLTSDLVGAWRIAREARGPAPPSVLVEALWAQARPAEEWAAALTAAGPLAVRRTDPTWKVEAKATKPAPAGTRLELTRDGERVTYRWEGFPLPGAEVPKRDNGPELTLSAVGPKRRRHPLIELSPWFTVRGVVAARTAAEPPVVEGAVEAYFSPDGRRVVLIYRCAIAGLDPTLVTKELNSEAQTSFGGWYVRALGPQVRVVDAGAGVAEAIRVAGELDRIGLAVTNLQRAQAAVAGTQIYYRGADGPALAERAKPVLPPVGEVAEAKKSGWYQLIVVLGSR